MVTVVFAHDVGQLFRMCSIPLAITAATPAFSSMARSLSLSPTASVAFTGDAQPVGQGQQGAALVHSCGRDLNVVRGALHHFHAFQRP